MAKKTQHIEKIYHSTQGGWHVYDVHLVGAQGWEYMLASAQHIADRDFSALSRIWRTDHPGGKEQEMLHTVTGTVISASSEMRREGSTLAVAGSSKSLQTMVKIVWINQTKVIRVFTLDDTGMLIEKYINALVDRRLPINGKKLLKKAEGKPAPAEKRFGAKVLLFMGAVWTAGGLFMATVLEGFMPFGIAWFVMSIGFMLWGAYYLGESKKASGQPVGGKAAAACRKT